MTITEQLAILTGGEPTAVLIEYNAHFIVYDSPTEAIKEAEEAGGNKFVDKETMIVENSIWNVSWFPRTPISHHSVYASSLEKALQWLLETPEGQTRVLSYMENN